MSLCSRCPDSTGGHGSRVQAGSWASSGSLPRGGHVTCTLCLPTPPVLVLGGGC